MQEKGHISTNQYIWLLFSIITSFSTLQIVGRLVKHAGRDAWLSVVIAWFVDIVLAVVYAYLGVRFPGQSMVQYSMTILGGFWGRLVGAIFSVFFLLSASCLIYGLCALLNNAFFPKTPVNALLVVCFALVAVGARKGLEVFSRTSEILGPLYLLSFIVLFSLAVPFGRFDNLKPQLYQGFLPMLTGTPFLLSFIGICIIMGMFIPYCSKPAGGFIGKVAAVTLGSAVFEGLIVLGIAVFGAEQTGNTVNIGLGLARIVGLGGTIQRLEAIWLMVSVAAAIMSAISLLWAFSIGIAQITGLAAYQPLVYPSALLTFIVTITSFENSNDLNVFANYIFPFIALFVESGLEYLLLIVALLRKKRGGTA